MCRAVLCMIVRTEEREKKTSEFKRAYLRRWVGYKQPLHLEHDRSRITGQMPSDSREIFRCRETYTLLTKNKFALFGTRLLKATDEVVVSIACAYRRKRIICNQSAR